MKIILTLISLFFTMCAFGQQHEEKESILVTLDDSWKKEFIQMPLGFAPQIPLKGEEEVRFAKGWATKDSDTFWTYAFVWKVALTDMLTAQQLELYMQYYFDGLMNVVNKDKDKVIPKTVALFLKKEKNTTANHFVGKIQLYDSFHTKDIITLNCTVMQYNCSKTKQALILFHFSPKEFGHATWDELNTVELKQNPCKQ